MMFSPLLATLSYRTIKVLQTRLLLAALLLFTHNLAAEEGNTLEYKVKAGYLYNFTKFVFWVKDESPTFNLCIVGNDPFGLLINPIEQQKTSGRAIKLIRSNHFSNSPHCHLIYLAKNAPNIGNANNSLLVCEEADFTKKHCMIGFKNADDKIRLEINVPLLTKNHLKISAKLLEVAQTVIQGDSND